MWTRLLSIVVPRILDKFDFSARVRRISPAKRVLMSQIAGYGAEVLTEVGRRLRSNKWN